MGWNNNGGGNSTMIIVVLIACCCMVLSCVPVILYFVYQPFKDWVDNLFKGDGTDANNANNANNTNNAAAQDTSGADAVTTCARDENVAGTIKYDPSLCQNLCLVDNTNAKWFVAKDGRWYNTQRANCTGTVVSADAGKLVCPVSINGKKTNGNMTKKVGTDGLTWCQQSGFPSTVASRLPANAIAGHLYNSTMITNGGGTYGPGASPKGFNNPATIRYLAR